MRALAGCAIAVLLLGPALAAAQGPSTLAQIEQTGTIRIGFRESEPPMSFLDDNREAAGYSIDLCSRIVTAVKIELNKADVEVVYVPVTAKDRFAALTENRIDILCGSTTKTLSRSKLVDFTQLTFVTGAALLSRGANEVARIGDLQDKRVAVVKGTTTIEALEGALEESLTEAEVVPVETASEGMRALVEGKVDAFSADQVVLIGLVVASDDPQSFVIGQDLFSFEPFALAVRRNDADFRLVADGVLSQLSRSRQIFKIYRKWFGSFSREMPPVLGLLYEINATPE